MVAYDKHTHKFVWQNAESLNDNYMVYSEVYQKYCFQKTNSFLQN